MARIKINIENRETGNYLFSLTTNTISSEAIYQESNIFTIEKSGTYYAHVKNKTTGEIEKVERLNLNCVDGVNVCRIYLLDALKVTDTEICTFDLLPYIKIQVATKCNIVTLVPTKVVGGLCKLNILGFAVHSPNDFITDTIVSYEKRIKYLDENDDPLMDLSIYRDTEGNVFVKDFANSVNFNKSYSQNDISNTTLKYIIVHDYDNYFSKNQGANGINLNAYKGRAIYITKAYVSNKFGYDIEDFVQLLIYVPTDDDSKLTKYLDSDGKYIDILPEEYEFNFKSRLPQYYTKLNSYPIDGSLIRNDQFIDYRELQNNETNLSRLGLLSRNGDKVTGYQFLGDYYLETLGHPSPYKYTQSQWNIWYSSKLATLGGISGLRDQILNKMFEVINPNKRLVMLNNEIHSGGSFGGSWNSEFTDIMNYCYGKIKEAYPHIVLIPWNTRSVLTPTSGELSSWWDRWQFTGSKYSFETTYGYESHGATIDKTNCFNVGSYFNSYSYGYKEVLRAFFEMLMAKKLRPDSIPLLNYWNQMENTFTQRAFKITKNLASSAATNDGNNGTIVAGTAFRKMYKGMVPTQYSEVIAAGAKFFNSKCGFVLWSEPSPKTDNPNDNPDSIYDIATGTRYKGYHETPRLQNLIPMTVDNHSITNDYFMIGDKKVSYHEKYWSIDPKFAEIKINGSYIGEKESFLGGTAQNKTPFVAYKKHTDGSIFIFAWNPCSSTIQEVGYKIDGVERTITMFGDFPSFKTI